MKNRYVVYAALLIQLLTFNIQHTFGQSPPRFKYQGVARDAAGTPIINASVGIKASVVNGLPNGPVVYSETHSTSTNAFGLFNLEIGGGTVLSGSFGTIAWGNGNKYLKNWRISKISSSCLC